MLSYKNKTYNFKKTTIYYENKQFMKINCCIIENYKICDVKSIKYKIDNRLYDYKNNFYSIYNSKIRNKSLINFINDLSLKINNDKYFNYDLTKNKQIVISELLRTINTKLIKNDSYDIIPIFHKTNARFYILYDVIKYIIEQGYNVSLIECVDNSISSISEEDSIEHNDDLDIIETDDRDLKFNKINVTTKTKSNSVAETKSNSVVETKSNSVAETKSDMRCKIIKEHIRSQFKCNSIMLEYDNTDIVLIITEINNNNNLLTQYINTIIFNTFDEKMIKSDVEYQISYNTNVLTEYNNNQNINTQLLINTIEKNNSLLLNLLN